MDVDLAAIWSAAGVLAVLQIAAFTLRINREIAVSLDSGRGRGPTRPRPSRPSCPDSSGQSLPRRWPAPHSMRMLPQIPSLT